ncbi:MAG: helix-turn-helix transcriptional regulator [Candidatus Eisenbacteria bacterium]|nr:helix-turn-helix transcriptional regulator [Candidatus Eisenbacteria bacterium]
METLATWERGQAKPLARHYGAIVRFLGYDPRPVGDGLPSRLNAIRRRLGLTQTELAARAGLDVRTVQTVETGRHRPSRRTLGRLARVLGPV